MANGTGNGNGGGLGDGFWKDMPWWVKAIAIVGVPSIISIGIVWSDRVQLASTVDLNRASLLRIEMTASEHDAHVKQRFDDLNDLTQETNRILTATCVNAAQTMVDRERCIGR